MSVSPDTAGLAHAIVEAIAERDYAVEPRFFDSPLLGALRAQCDSLHAAGRFRPAGVGRAAQRLPAARSDEIAWLETERSGPAVAAVLRRFDALRRLFNRTLYLGLQEFECHLAHYPPGACYRRHRDQLRGQSSRRLSCVLYLNDCWRPEDGGALRLYLDESGDFLEVLPADGTLVCFLSERFEHEVLPATRSRWTLTGWFRTR
jgi:SM-20-related protein